MPYFSGINLTLNSSNKGRSYTEIDKVDCSKYQKTKSCKLCIIGFYGKLGLRSCKCREKQSFPCFAWHCMSVNYTAGVTGWTHLFTDKSMHRTAFFALRITVSEKILCLVKCIFVTYKSSSYGCLQFCRSCLLFFISFHIGHVSFFPHKVIENQHNSKHLTGADLHHYL